MIKCLKLNDIIDDNKYKNKTVADILENNKSALIKLVKEGYHFDDEVINFANYKKDIRDEKVIFEFVNRKTIKDTKKYTKDSIEKVKKFIQDLSTIDNSYITDNEEIIEDEK